MTREAASVRHRIRFSPLVLLLLVPLTGAAWCAVTVEPVLTADHIDDWVFDGSGEWALDAGTLRLHTAGRPSGPIRRPAALALVRHPPFGTVTVEAEVRSTADPSLEVADVLLVFGYASPTRFSYVHLSGRTDGVHNGIFVVDDADRRRIDAGDGVPQLRDRAWHRVRMRVDGAAGRVEVFVDDAEAPGLAADHAALRLGLVGFGSFDDTAEIRHVRIVGEPSGE